MVRVVDDPVVGSTDEIICFCCVLPDESNRVLFCQMSDVVVAHFSSFCVV